MRGSGYDRTLRLQAIFIIGAGVVLVGLLLGVLKLQTSMQLWLYAHHRWVQAETQMADALEAYAITGDDIFLRRANDAMRVPLGARAARVAADTIPIDRDGIRRGLADMGIDQRDIDGMAWVYIQMGNWSYIRDAVAVWSRVEPDIDRLAGIGKAIQADVETGNLTQASAIAHRDAIATIRKRFDASYWEFSGAIISGLRVLRMVLVAISILLFAAFVVLFMYVLRKFISRIQSSEGWLRASFEQANVGMLQLASDGQIRYANSAASRILGVRAEACIDQKLQDFIVYRDQARFSRALGGTAVESQSFEDSDQYLVLTADGRQQVVRASMSKVAGAYAAEEIGMRFAMIEDVTEAHAMRAELARQARYDDLTGLYNRGELLRRIGHALHELKEDRIEHLSVCLIDLDRFRFINESVGLRLGDRILQVIAHRLHDAMGRVGVAGRLGGDQFLMVLPGMDSSDAMAFASRVAEALSQPDKELADSTMTPTNSIGVVSVDRLYTSASEVLAAADAACERAKQAGRNRVRLLMREEDEGSDGRSHADWATEIRAAMGSGRMELQAQRIEPCHPGIEPARVEVLLRMRDAADNLVTPNHFLHVAEMYGLTMDIDRQVLSMAIEAIRVYAAADGVPMKFFINLSASSVGEPDFALYVGQLLDTHLGLASMLCFEITETGVMANLQQATAFMDMVRQRGCMVALDDFGTGQSSFSQLRVLPVDIVKIDGSFVRDLDSDATSEVLIRSICEMSHVLGKRTVVEWVERREDADRMSSLGADYMQGFGLHRPQPLSEILA